jgi:hypothetical protein
MPNWEHNKLTITGQPEAVNTIYEAFKGSNIFATLIGKDPAYDTYTTEQKLDHNCKTYGTKWDISNESPEQLYKVNGTELRFTVHFRTAWDAPREFILTLCKKYKVRAEIRQLDEPLVKLEIAFINEEGEALYHEITEYQERFICAEPYEVFSVTDRINEA